jgi:hypothetical protein
MELYFYLYMYCFYNRLLTIIVNNLFLRNVVQVSEIYKKFLYLLAPVLGLYESYNQAGESSHSLHRIFFINCSEIMKSFIY